MPTFTIAAGTTSRPHFAPAGSIVKVSPAAGATAVVEYTTASSVEIANGVAAWMIWPKGTVSAETSDLAFNAEYVRVTAVGGIVPLDIETSPSAGKLAPFRSDWSGSDQITGRNRPPRTFVWGDSITYLGRVPLTIPLQPMASQPQNAVQTSFSTRAWYARAGARLNGRLNIVGARGHTGGRLDQISAFFDSDVLPSRPSLLILEGGSNDLDTAGKDANTAFAAIMEIYKKCQANGITLLYVGTTAVRGNSVNTEPAKLRTLAMLAAQQLRGFMFYDWWPLLGDYTQTATNMAWMAQISGITIDSTHPVGMGCRIMGDGLATFLDPLLPKQPLRVSTNTAGSSGNPLQLVSNNLLGYGGAPTGTTGTGCSATNMPDRFDLRRSAGTGISGTLTNNVRTDGGPGRAVALAVASAAADTDVLSFSWNVQGNYTSYAVLGAIGTQCRGEVEVSYPAPTTGAINNINVIVKAYSSTTDNSTTLGTWQSSEILSQAAIGGSSNGGSSEYWLDNAAFAGLLRTPDFTLPAGTHHVSIDVQIMTSTGAQVTVTIANPQIISDQCTALLPAGYF